MSTPLVLASTSPYRRALLERLRLPFETMAPEVDETPHADEPPQQLARRLAREKALDASGRRAGALVIGSDQVASCDGKLLAKPGTAQRACDQLRLCSGRSARFDTAVCLARDSKVVGERCVPSEVLFRALDEEAVRRYVALERPLDCAGSFRWERLGISLFAALRGDDPTALEGLPLIALCDLLRDQGVDVLKSAI
jgi:septum formation protein